MRDCSCIGLSLAGGMVPGGGGGGLIWMRGSCGLTRAFSKPSTTFGVSMTVAGRSGVGADARALGLGLLLRRLGRLFRRVDRDVRLLALALVGAALVLREDHR